MMLHPIDEADLRWYLAGWYEGEMGLHSSMGQMLEMLEAGGYWVPRIAGSFEPSELAIAAASREGRVRRALRAVRPELACVLRATYGPSSCVLDGWGQLGAAAALTRAAGAGYVRSRTSKAMTDWLVLMGKRARQGDVVARRLVDRIMVEATELVGAAGRAYRDASRRKKWT